MSLPAVTIHVIEIITVIIMIIRIAIIIKYVYSQNFEIWKFIKWRTESLSCDGL